MRPTNLVSLLLAIAAAALALFAWWGLYTVAGRRRFDEMAGMIPMGSGVLAIVLALAAIAVRWFGARTTPRDEPRTPAANSAGVHPSAPTHGVDDEIREAIRQLVWGGYHAEAAVEEMARDVAEGPVDESALRDAVAAEFARKGEAERSWPRETDCDRLDRAFAALDAQGIVALQNAGVTMSDGLEDVADARESRGAARCRGYCFFHRQDIERAVDGMGLLIAFGSFDDDPAARREVGRTVRRAMEDAGFVVTWDEDPEQRLNLPNLAWRRRGP